MDLVACASVAGGVLDVLRRSGTTKISCSPLRVIAAGRVPESALRRVRRIVAVRWSITNCILVIKNHAFGVRRGRQLWISTTPLTNGASSTTSLVAPRMSLVAPRVSFMTARASLMAARASLMAAMAARMTPTST